MIPAIARYESWNPRERTTEGFASNWIVSAEQRITSGRWGRFVRIAVSRSRMKREALTIDGEAPVACTYSPDRVMIMIQRNRLAAGLCPKTAVAQSMSIYMTPR